MTAAVQKKKSALWIVLIVVALSFAAGIYYKWRETPQIVYHREPVKKGNIEIKILSTGVAAPENRVDVKAPIPGRAEKVLVVEGQKVRKGQILLWMSSTERAALLDAARARGAEDYKHWESFYQPTPVLAPIDGTIILRNVQPGQTFTTSDAILSMSDRLTIQAQVDETDLAQVHLKQEANIVLDAYPDQSITAHVTKMAYDAKTNNNVTTYVVDVTPDTVPDFMRSGMTANVTFYVTVHRDVLLVPNDAMKFSKDGKVSVLKADGDRAPASPTEIQTGASDGKRTEVVAGLSEGDVLLVPQFKIRGPPTITNPFASGPRKH